MKLGQSIKSSVNDLLHFSVRCAIINPAVGLVLWNSLMESLRIPVGMSVEVNIDKL